MNTINIRRSIRSFNGVEVEDEKVLELLKAGMQAPSAMNQQPWEFVVVRDKNVREKLSEISPYAKPIVLGSVVIVLTINNNNVKVVGKQDQDMGACTQNILLEAVEQGLAAVWIGVKPDVERMNIISDVLSLPDNIEPFAIIAVGYSDVENKFIDRFDKEKIHFDKY
ncbi:MAG: nitroreductase family protein [Bacilli bacterium]